MAQGAHRDARADARCTMYGKLPWAADYLRVNHQHPASLAFDAFLQASQQQLALAGAGWPLARVRFVYSDASSSTALVGVLSPSRDRAGRKFPVSVFARLPLSTIARCFSRLPLGFAPFFDRVEESMDRLAGQDRDAALSAIAELIAPGTSDLWTPEVDAAVSATSARGIAKALFAREPEYSLVAASETLVARVRDACGSGPRRAPVFELPCLSAAQAAYWLALAEHGLSGTGVVPSIFWSPSAPRLFLSICAPPPALLLWLSDPARRSERLCPIARLPREPSPGAAGIAPDTFELGPARFAELVAARCPRV